MGEFELVFNVYINVSNATSRLRCNPFYWSSLLVPLGIGMFLLSLIMVAMIYTQSGGWISSIQNILELDEINAFQSMAISRAKVVEAIMSGFQVSSLLVSIAEIDPCTIKSLRILSPLRLTLSWPRLTPSSSFAMTRQIWYPSTSASELVLRFARGAPLVVAIYWSW